MKINAKVLSERVDYYIDLMLECECQEPDENKIESGAEPEEGEKQKNEIVDDITEELDIDEELTYLEDDEDDIDSEKDLDAKDNGNGETDEEAVDEGIFSLLTKSGRAKKAAEELAKRRALLKHAQGVGNKIADMGVKLR